MNKLLMLIMSVSILGASACSPGNTSKESDDTKVNIAEDTRTPGKVEVPSWAKNATIYEMNIRQFTPEGTFAAILPHLQRLADMGVDIIWLMPVHPISETKRKGSLGSYYAVNDFRDVNPEYGTVRDLQVLIGQAHNLGMKVIIDWVPHHTGWDHPWITEHPEWFSKDEEGNIIDPINEETGEPWGWTDVAELDLSNPEMRKEIISDMIFWIEGSGIDGFRVDHAHGLPDDYWDEVSVALSRLNQPIFMLAEGEEPRLRNKENFVATYAWKFHHAMNDIAKGEKSVNVLDTILAEDRAEYTSGYHMYFTSNHDENSWAGTVMERMGDGHQTFAVFEKDPIDWNDYEYADFYMTLSKLKKRNPALWNGAYGGLSERINTSDSVYAFMRKKDEAEIYVILNLTDQEQTTELSVDAKGRNVFGGPVRSVKANEEITLAPWEYIVLSNR